IFPPRTHDARTADDRLALTADTGPKEVVMLLRERDASLPDQPSLEWYRKHAKALLRAVRAGDAGAQARAAEALGEPPSEPGLADAQRIVAREHGYGSWAAFRRAVLEAAGAEVRTVSRMGIQDVDAYDATARELQAAAARGDARALLRLRTNVARLARVDDDA